MKAGVRVLLLKDGVWVDVYFRKEKQTKNKPGMKGVQGSGALGLSLLDSPAGPSLGPSSKMAWESKGHRRQGQAGPVGQSVPCSLGSLAMPCI